MTIECRFCGQSIVTMTDDPQEAQVEANKLCDCNEAVRYRRLKAASETINRLFGEDNEFGYRGVDEQTKTLLNALCAYVVDGVISNAVITLGGGQRAKIGETYAGEISIERKRVDTQKLIVSP